MNVYGASVEAVDHEFLNSLIRAGVESLGEQLDDSVTQSDIYRIGDSTNPVERFIHSGQPLK